MLSAEAVALISRQLAEVHRAAQERLGLTGALVVYDAWKSINVTAPVMTAEFIADVLKVVRALRGVSLRLSGRYYNLSRALGTGNAFPDISSAFTERASLEDLYAAMAESINEVVTSTTLDIKAPSSTRDVPAATADDTAPVTGRVLDRRLSELESVLIKEFQQTFPSADADLAQPIEVETPENWDWPELGNEKVLDENLLADMEAKAIKDLQDIVDRELASQRNVAEGLRIIQDEADKHGAIAAAQADADAIAPGRQLVTFMGEKDRRRVSWMRVSGEHPCGFCSMLVSRGAVYQTAESAGYGNLYHPNCHCHQIPIFTEEPYYSERDQYFIDNWDSEIKDKFSGRAALNAWRTWLAQQYREGLVPEQDIFGPARPVR